MPTFTPDIDSAIARKYSAKTLEGKVQNKTALQEELGWPEESKIPLLCLPAGMTDDLGGKVLQELLPGLLTLPVQIVILGKGSAAYGTIFTKMAKDYPHRIAILENKEEMIHKMYAASDMALFLANTSDMAEVDYALSYGVVPVAPESENLKNYDPNQENGTAFLYEGSTVWHAFGALVRALETFRFPYDWKTIQKQCMGN